MSSGMEQFQPSMFFALTKLFSTRTTIPTSNTDRVNGLKIPTIQSSTSLYSFLALRDESPISILKAIVDHCDDFEATDPDGLGIQD